MGQKVNPKAFRLGGLYTWDSRWFLGKGQYKKFILEDLNLRKALTEKLRPAGISRIEIERSINKVDVILHVSRPGIVIGRAGSGLEEIKKFVEKIIFPKKDKLNAKLKLEIKVEPIKEPNLDAYLVAVNVADQLIKRLPPRRVCSQAINKTQAAGAKGVKIILSGRIGGAEISRRETYKEGTIPLSTLREDIDFARFAAKTRSGYVGVKVWICK